MENTYIGILVFLLSLVASTAAFPRVLRFAREHNIVDNPNARKLQRVPVPVMGGVAVYVGIMAGCIVLDILMFDKVLTWGLAAMTLMMLIGVWDDVKDTSAKFKTADRDIPGIGFHIYYGYIYRRFPRTVGHKRSAA